MKTVIIGLSGPAGCGKDTLADALCDQAGFTRIALATPIKAMLEALYTHIGVPAGAWTARDKKETAHPMLGVSYREMMQTLGTEWAQHVLGRRHFLTAIAHDKIAAQIGEGTKRIVVTDIRFPHEAEWLRSIGGKLWAIDRPSIAPVRAHTSESHFDRLNADWIVRNHGSIDELSCIAVGRARQMIGAHQ